MKKISILLGAVLAVAIFSLNAEAYRGHGGMGPGYGYGFPERMSAALNLSAEQSEQIQSLRVAHLKEIQPLRNSLYAKSQELKLLWLEKTPDQEKIQAATREIRAIRDQITDKSIQHRLAVMKVLTPEQQAKLQSYGPGSGAAPGWRMGKGGY